MALRFLMQVCCLGLILTPILAHGAPQEKKVPPSYVKLRLQIELCGVLTVSDGHVTLRAPGPDFEGPPGAGEAEQPVWVLDLGKDKELQKKAAALHGKRVEVTGTALLVGRSATVASLPPLGTGTPLKEVVPVLRVDRKVKVTSVEAAAEK